MAEPSASREIDCGGPLDSLPISDSRVSSPKAAKIAARSASWARRSSRLRDMALDVRHLGGPTAIVHAECFEPAALGNGVKSGFREHKKGAAIFRFKPELDEGCRLVRVVNGGIDRIRVPRERKKPFRLHFLHRRLPLIVFV